MILRTKAKIVNSKFKKFDMKYLSCLEYSHINNIYINNVAQNNMQSYLDYIKEINVQGFNAIHNKYHFISYLKTPLKSLLTVPKEVIESGYLNKEYEIILSNKVIEFMLNFNSIYSSINIYHGLFKFHNNSRFTELENDIEPTTANIKDIIKLNSIFISDNKLIGMNEFKAQINYGEATNLIEAIRSITWENEISNLYTDIEFKNEYIKNKGDFYEILDLLHDLRVFIYFLLENPLENELCFPIFLKYSMLFEVAYTIFESDNILELDKKIDSDFKDSFKETLVQFKKDLLSQKGYIAKTNITPQPNKDMYKIYDSIAKDLINT